jgi:hypothetical protein
MFARGLPTSLAIWYLLITLQSNCKRVLDNLCRHLQEGCAINKERGNLFATPLKKLKVKIKNKIRETTGSFKVGFVDLYHL